MGGYVQYAVCVKVESHFDLRHSTRSRRNAVEVEVAQQLVVSCKFAFALVNLYLHGWLLVSSRAEDFRFFCRDCCVALNKRSEYSTERLNAERERRDVEQQHVIDFAFQDARLYSGSDSNDFVRVHPFVRVASEDFLREFLHAGHTGRATNEDNLVY